MINVLKIDNIKQFLIDYINNYSQTELLKYNKNVIQGKFYNDNLLTCSINGKDLLELINNNEFNIYFENLIKNTVSEFEKTLNISYEDQLTGKYFIRIEPSLYGSISDIIHFRFTSNCVLLKTKRDVDFDNRINKILNDE